jgi:hypothetical protein
MWSLPLARHECFRSADLEETREKVRHILGPRCLKFASRDTGLDARMHSCQVRDMSVNFVGYGGDIPARAPVAVPVPVGGWGAAGARGVVLGAEERGDRSAVSSAAGVLLATAAWSCCTVSVLVVSEALRR